MGPAAKSAATSEAAGPERYRRVVPRLRAGGPMMPPSTKRAPAASTMRPISRAVAGDTALPSTKIPRNPVAATARARSTAPCGGITGRITRLDFTRPATPRASPSPPPGAPPLLPRPAPAPTLFAGQFLKQFFAIANGMPPGLASIVVQAQAFFTILFVALALQERPRPGQVAGIVLAFGGLGLIALTIGGDLSAVGFLLALGSAISWGIGNVLLKRVGGVDMLSLIVWLSVVPPIPSLALSMLLDGPRGLGALVRGSWLGLAAALYLGVVATVLAYAIWGRLLRRYPAATVTPFALLAPIVGAYSSSVIFGECFGGRRLAGMALVLLGVAITVLSGSPRDAPVSA